MTADRRRAQTLEHPSRREDDEQTVWDQIVAQLDRLAPVLEDIHERLRRGEL